MSEKYLKLPENDREWLEITSERYIYNAGNHRFIVNFHDINSCGIWLMCLFLPVPQGNHKNYLAFDVEIQKKSSANILCSFENDKITAEIEHINIDSGFKTEKNKTLIKTLQHLHSEYFQHYYRTELPEGDGIKIIGIHFPEITIHQKGLPEEKQICKIPDLKLYVKSRKGSGIATFGHANVAY